MLIYAIRELNHDRIIYIGSTTRTLEQRYDEHRRALEEYGDYVEGRKETFSKGNMALYQGLYWLKKNRFDIRMEVLLDIKDMKYRRGWRCTERDLRLIECAMIAKYQPEYNLAGRSQFFIWDYQNGGYEFD